MMRRRSAQDSRVLRLRLCARRVLRPRSGRLLSAFLKPRREVEKPVEVFDAEQFERMPRWGQPDDAYACIASCPSPGRIGASCAPSSSPMPASSRLSPGSSPVVRTATRLCHCWQDQ
ncbi:hypothetical protein SEVIR_5G084050v4 [Setaria viridis]|uniref:Uncharacterized protein n=1 Tax=Setaria viridis TaxID=4556 RepID=A0A4U6UBD3_SETVI|nr:hypothetical protein SEVIR_5G084050v2 [Setaria viridis]